MKKLILVCVLSLLSATSLFGGYKEKLRATAAKAEKFIDRNLNVAADKIEEFLENNLSSEKIEATVKKTKKEIARAFKKAKNFINDENPSAPETFTSNDAPKTAHDKPGQHMHHLKFSRVDAILASFEETVIAAFANAKKYMVQLDLATLATSSKNAKNNIDHFTEKYNFIIKEIRDADNDSDPIYLPTNLKTSSKPDDFDMTDSEHTDLCNDYHIFITSCMYLTVLQDVALHGKSDCINSMGKKYYMLNQLADLMEIQSSDLNKRTKCAEEASL